MKEDDFLFTVPDGRSRHRYWLAGMDWAPQKKQSVRLPSLSRKKAPSGTGVGVQVATGREPARVVGRGRLPARHRRHQLYSLALLFCARIRNGYGIYRLSSTDYVFLASINGLPAVTADKMGGAGRMKELLSLFLSMNEPPVDGWDCQATLENPVEAAGLTTGLSARTRQRCRVQVDGRRQQHVLIALALVLSGTCAAAWWQASAPQEEPALSAEEIQARAREMFARPAEPQVLPHPWASLITVPDLLSRCRALQSPAPSVLEAWEFTSGSCSPDGVSLLYRVKPGGTVEGFLKRSRDVFGVPPIFNLKEGGREARIPLALPDSPFINEAVPDAATQLMRILSWFQRRQVMLNIVEVPPAIALPGSNGSPPPVQDWKEYTFSFTGPVPPATLFDGMDNTGVRLTRITFELNGSAYSYTTEGQIYASTK
ncbi:type 4b pilus protein PilO2 (plasmid) [Leclercia adecarboxylata]|uniref:type 4b pilus protein PilO2 n=1 Tax=Leclercia adecarboxylata TaxID=83655 RepID=UPI0025AEF3D8|nr:type 4b pilus protein PilO2 [Leclercia adecarboxylata]WJT05498.1 type 4b pilus protein PilO2 [Leclercia adecarboxylata]